MPTEKFKTVEYRRDARQTFGRMSQTTLRVTGLEPVLERANAKNKAVLRNLIGDKVRFDGIVKECGNSTVAIWREVKKATGSTKIAEEAGAVPIIAMSLGNPNAYPDFPPNHTLMECMRESWAETNDRISCSYTESYGLPQLLEYLQRVNLSDPSSVNKDPAKFSDVKTIITVELNR